MEEYFCPECGKKLIEWIGGILECEDCGGMFDEDVLEEINGVIKNDD